MYHKSTDYLLEPVTWVISKRRATINAPKYLFFVQEIVTNCHTVLHFLSSQVKVILEEPDSYNIKKRMSKVSLLKSPYEGMG